MKSDTSTTKQRYDRLAPFFDLLEAPMEGLVFKPWREKLWAKVDGQHILEVGVGTGKNFYLYPKGVQMTAIDFSPAMLKVARNNQQRKGVEVMLDCQDVQSLCYADNCFDSVVASFVFCSVPQPNKGLKEIYRVLKPGGRLYLLEHVLSANPLVAAIMNLLNPLVLRLVGANINRNTVKTVQACPFSSVRVDENSGDIVKLIEAVK